MGENIKNNKYERSAAFLFVLFLFIQVFNTVLKDMVKNPFIDNYLTIILGLVYLIGFIFSLKNIRKAVPIIIILESVFGLLLLISLMVNLQYSSQIISRCIWTLAFCIPLFAIFLGVTDFENILNKSRISVFFISFLALFPVIKYISSNSYEYDMTLGYYLLYSLILSFISIGKNLVYLLIFIIDFAFIIIIGSRGPMLCFSIFFLLYLLFYNNSNPKTRFFKAVLLILLISFVLFSDHLLAVFNKYGIYSRNLNKIISGSLLSDSGRSEIYDLTISRIEDNALFGIGVGGELSYMKSYPHNIFLELLLHYGLFAGGLICLIILVATAKSLYISRFNCSFEVVLLCSGFIPLLLSGTYLQSPLCWVFMAVALVICKRGWRRC